MRTNESIIYGVTGQNLNVRFIQGRPTAVSFAVYLDTTDEDGTPEFSGTATIDSFSSTITTATGYTSANATALALASTTGMVSGRKYLLAGSQQREWVEPVRIESLAVTARHPLAGDYLSGATLVSTYATALVDATWVATLGKLSDIGNPWPDYRIKWTATISGATVVEYGYFDLVRTIVNYGIDIESVNLRAPGLRNSMPTEYARDAGATLLQSSWLSLQANLAAIGMVTDSMRDAQFIDEAMTLKALAILAAGGWHPLGIEWQSYYDATREAFGTFINQHLQSTQRHARTDGTTTITRTAPLWEK